MSGDVQPRKRKDKKKRKEDGDGLTTSLSSSNNEDIQTIHVHKDGGTGGNICAKIVFFLLFSALILLIGLIIKENQGLSELENVDSSESRFSQIFEGWTDKTVDEHDDHHSSLEELSDEHNDDDDDDDDLHNEEESEGNEDNAEENHSEEISEEAQNEEDEESNEIEEEQTEETPQTEEDNEESNEEEIELSEEKKDDESQQEEDQDEEIKENDDDDDDENSVEQIENNKNSEERINQKPSIDEEPSSTKESSGHVNVVEEHVSHDISDDSEKDDDYEHADITNVDDYLIKDEIDAANNQHLNKKNVAYANKLFETLLEKYPQSPRIIYGKALILDKLADQEKSNELLNMALNYYLQALNAPNVPDKLFINIAERFIDRAHFLGQYKKAIGVHWNLIERFPENSSFYNRLAVTYLTINLAEEARMVLQKVLTKWPSNGFALVHYGFILKTVDNKLEKSIEFMSKGLKTREKGVIDGRFYFHLGDALARLNRNKEAEQLYIEGVKEKVFKSIYQRSLYNVDRLTAQSWWELEDIPQYRNLFSELIHNYEKIREEGLNALKANEYFKDEAENLKDTGEWKQLELFARGKKSAKNCIKSPVTCSIIEKFTYASGCKRGQTKFSVMHPGTHVWPHCGPTNCRLRIHLGLKIPANTFIRVAKEIRSWKEGELFIFDDSFEHEVWHNGSEFRLVLIVDVWHPELTPTERRSLSPI